MIDNSLVTYAILDALSEKGKDIIDLYIPLVAKVIIEDKMDTIESNNFHKTFRSFYGIEKGGNSNE